MKTWSFYHEDTGELASTVSRLSDSIDPNGFAPAGHKPIEGLYDRITQRIDPVTRLVIAREMTAEQKQALKARTSLARIQALELSQPRALREAALDVRGGRERLQAIDDEIAQLRADLI